VRGIGFLIVRKGVAVWVVRVDGSSDILLPFHDPSMVFG
jgi:hypothetical protein